MFGNKIIIGQTLLISLAIYFFIGWLSFGYGDFKLSDVNDEVRARERHQIGENRGEVEGIVNKTIWLTISATNHRSSRM